MNSSLRSKLEDVGIKVDTQGRRLEGSLEALQRSFNKDISDVNKELIGCVAQSEVHQEVLESKLNLILDKNDGEMAALKSDMDRLKSMMNSILDHVFPICMVCGSRDHLEGSCCWLTLICHKCGVPGHAVILHDVKDETLRARLVGRHGLDFLFCE